MAAAQEPGYYNLLDGQTCLIHLAGQWLDEIKASVKIHPKTDSQRGREYISSIKTILPSQKSLYQY